MSQYDEPPQGTSQARDERRRQLAIWLWRLPVLLALGGGGVAAYRAYQVHFGKLAPTPEPCFEPIQPQAVARLEELSGIWSAVTFVVGTMPAITIRLPEPIPGGLMVNGSHYAAFSRVCTHLGCLTYFNTDLSAIALGYNYRSQTPAFTCPCHLSVFLPLEAGKAVSGPAVEPLPRVQLELRDGALYAVGLDGFKD